MSSDKLGDIQKPILNLDLDLVENGQRRMESIELSRSELERIISSLEAANKVDVCGVWVKAESWLMLSLSLSLPLSLPLSLSLSRSLSLSLSPHSPQVVSQLRT